MTSWPTSPAACCGRSASPSHSRTPESWPANRDRPISCQSSSCRYLDGAGPRQCRTDRSRRGLRTAGCRPGPLRGSGPRIDGRQADHRARRQADKVLSMVENWEEWVQFETVLSVAIAVAELCHEPDIGRRAGEELFPASCRSAGCSSCLLSSRWSTPSPTSSPASTRPPICASRRSPSASRAKRASSSPRSRWDARGSCAARCSASTP